MNALVFADIHTFMSLLRSQRNMSWAFITILTLAYDVNSDLLDLSWFIMLMTRNQYVFLGHIHRCFVSRYLSSLCSFSTHQTRSFTVLCLSEPLQKSQNDSIRVLSGSSPIVPSALLKSLKHRLALSPIVHRAVQFLDILDPLQDFLPVDWEILSKAQGHVKEQKQDA